MDTAVNADKLNARRMHAVLIIELVFWLVIVEGSLRKWFFPFAEKPLFFIKDPLVLYLYYWCWRFRLYPRNARLFTAGLLLSAIAWLLGVSHVLEEKLVWATALYGWRMYFLYLPLSFIAGHVLEGKDLKRIAVRLMFSAIPMAAIVFLQYKSAPDAWINKCIGEGSVAFMYAGTARASGTFTFTQGHELYCHLLTAVLFATWLMASKFRPVTGWWLYIISAATAVNVLLDGNRGVFFLVGAVWAASIVHRMFLSRLELSARQFTPELFFALAFLLYSTVFSQGLQSMQARMEQDAGTNGSGHLQRILDTALFPVEKVKSARLLGRGIGMGTPAGQNLSKELPTADRVVEEDELSRVIGESGVLGIAYIIFRYILAASILVGSLVASRRTGNPVPIMLATFSVHLLLFGQMTLNGSCHGFAFVVIGFSLAATQLGLPCVKVQHD